MTYSEYNSISPAATGRLPLLSAVPGTRYIYRSVRTNVWRGAGLVFYEDTSKYIIQIDTVVRTWYMWYILILQPNSIPFIIFALLFLSLLLIVVTQIRGHIVGSSPPSPLRFVPCKAFLSRENSSPCRLLSNCAYPR